MATNTRGNTRNHLPLEIICSIIASVTSKSSLCNLALCSSQFYWLTVPVLYSHVELYIPNRRFKKLQPLTVFFLEKPTLARYVRHFTLRDLFQVEKPNRKRTWDIGILLADAILANSHSIEERDEWMLLAARDYQDVLLAILLPTMVRLEKLELTIRYEYEYFDRMITRAIAKKKPFDKQPLFPVLTEFMHVASGLLDDQQPDYYDWNHEPMSSQYNILFQNFPSIRSIYSHRVFDYGNEPIQNTFTSMSSSITHLELKNGFVNRPNLCTILRTPKALQTFIYEIFSSAGMPPYPNGAIDILSALTPQSNSLENLWIDYEDEGDVLPEFRDVYNISTPSLSSFNRLKNLRVAAEVLLEFLHPDQNEVPFWRNFSGVFPATLETLHIIYKYNITHWEDVRGFIIAELSQVPRLQSIIIECPSWVSGPPPDWKELQEHAKSNGVELISLVSTLDFRVNEYFERGWGMDGSIQWGRCVGDLNTRQIPLIREWKNDWESKYTPGYKVESKDLFYQWHLCPESRLRETYEDTMDDQNTEDDATDDEATDDPLTDDMNSVDRVDE
jgi:hypothetical protein